ncbi:MAG: hypothetical protein OEU36_25255, partial [Gammaproteobacteria bacterium]|nr:hypothetical protein [Gammaproteobacteria bacterium]
MIKTRVNATNVTEDAFASPNLPAKTLVELLVNWATACPDQLVYTYCAEDGVKTTLTFGELDQRARAIAGSIQRRTKPGDRALMVYPPGLEFVTAF